MKQKTVSTATRPALRALTLRLGLVIFVLWLALSCAITYATAQTLYHHFADLGTNYPEYLSGLADREAHYSAELGTIDLPGFNTYFLYGMVRDRYHHVSPPWTMPHLRLDEPQPLNLFRDNLTVTSVAAVMTEDGQVLAETGNFFRFPYFFEEQYRAQDYTTQGYAVCVMDHQMDVDTARFKMSQSFGSRLYDSQFFRFTGVLENGYLTLQKIEYQNEYGEGWSEGYTFYDTMPEGSETVTLYTDYVDVSKDYEPGGSISYQQQRYDDLLQLAAEIGPHFSGHATSYSQYGMTEMLCTGARYYANGWESFEVQAASPLPGCRLVTVLQASPLKSAASALLPLHLITFLLTLLLFLLLRQWIKKHLIRPVQDVVEGIDSGWHFIDTPDDKPLQLQEPARLRDQYYETMRQRTEDRDTIARLEKAVQYAQEAEQNRKQLTSAVAHELKTPLAVIHSYTEGLQERIAEDKRDQYLQVILDETRRMDAMVLEMLDLSRLEAGRVKLQRSNISLTQLTRQVFDRLALAARAKELQITLQLPEECTVNADGTRLEQVITNFAVNAVKYTPVGGKITVQLQPLGKQWMLTVENDSPPLPQQALDRVWDTFYRADESRSSEGSGLGLAIAKSIIDLHGGRCIARNSENGVIFGFLL